MSFWKTAKPTAQTDYINLMIARGYGYEGSARGSVTDTESTVIMTITPPEGYACLIYRSNVAHTSWFNYGEMGNLDAWHINRDYTDNFSDYQTDLNVAAASAGDVAGFFTPDGSPTLTVYFTDTEDGDIGADYAVIRGIAQGGSNGVLMNTEGTGLLGNPLWVRDGDTAMSVAKVSGYNEGACVISLQALVIPESQLIPTDGGNFSTGLSVV